MDYQRLGRRDLSKILRCNPPAVPHYQEALEERKRRDQFRVLIISCAAILLPVTSSFCVHANRSTPQIRQGSWQRQLTMNQQFENYKNDFVQFGQSTQARPSRNGEDLTDVQVVAIADHTVSHLEYVETMVAAYLKVSSKLDRQAVWPLIADQIDMTKKRVDRQVQVTNALLSILKTPGAVGEAMHMRDDLRRIEEGLDGAMKEIEAAEAKLP